MRISCFVSHTWTAGQHDLAKYVARRLKRFPDLSAWFDEDKIFPGQRLSERIREGLADESDCCVALLSSEYMSANNAPKELEAASALAFEKGYPLFPVRLDTAPIPEPIRDIVAADFNGCFTSQPFAINARFHAAFGRLVRGIRAKFDASAEELRFFNPENRARNVLVTNRTYSGPYPVPNKSTTVEFIMSVQRVATVLARRDAITKLETCETDYFQEGTEVAALVDGHANLVSYASSKINPCTELMLSRICTQFGVEIRFVLERDLRCGRLESALPCLERGVPVALRWMGTSFFPSETLDHGIVLRVAPAGSKRIWWIVAGCGRPASVAARMLIFENGWGGRLWSQVGRRLGKASFVARFSVKHQRSKDASLGELVDFEVLWLDRNTSGG